MIKQESPPNLPHPLSQSQSPPRLLPQKASRIIIQSSAQQLLFLMPKNPPSRQSPHSLSHPQPQFVALKSLILNPPGNFDYTLYYARAAKRCRKISTVLSESIRTSFSGCHQRQKCTIDIECSVAPFPVRILLRSAPVGAADQKDADFISCVIHRGGAAHSPFQQKSAGPGTESRSIARSGPAAVTPVNRRPRKIDAGSGKVRFHDMGSSAESSA